MWLTSRFGVFGWAVFFITVLEKVKCALQLRRKSHDEEERKISNNIYTDSIRTDYSTLLREDSAQWALYQVVSPKEMMAPPTVSPLLGDIRVPLGSHILYIKVICILLSYNYNILLICVQKCCGEITFFFQL